MRRLFLVPILLALLAVPAEASAAHANLEIVAGAAHPTTNNVLRGWFLVANEGNARSTRERATVRMLSHNVLERPAMPLVPPLAPGERIRLKFRPAAPQRYERRDWAISVCVIQHCRKLGKFVIGERGNGQPTAVQAGARGTQNTIPLPAASPSIPISTVPADPIPYVAGEPFHHTAGAVEYWGFVPRSYDPSNLTPTPLLIWLHGCGGESSGDIWVVDPGADEEEPQDWMTLALGGREGGCWNPLAATEPLVMAALADFETHFNVNRRRVILGGYSSGGDLAYRTGFFHSSTFAGLLIENSAPFRDTEASEAELLGTATTKFHIVHLAHEEDETYELAEVKPEVAAVKAAGFPIELIERPGNHWNDPGEMVAGHAVPGTDADLRELLLPHIDDGWLAPAP